jgi:hypothetical protein
VVTGKTEVLDESEAVAVRTLKNPAANNGQTIFILQLCRCNNLLSRNVCYRWLTHPGLSARISLLSSATRL